MFVDIVKGVVVIVIATLILVKVNERQEETRASFTEKKFWTGE